MVLMDTTGAHPDDMLDDSEGIEFGRSQLSLEYDRPVLANDAPSVPSSALGVKGAPEAVGRLWPLDPARRSGSTGGTTAPRKTTTPRKTAAEKDTVATVHRASVEDGGNGDPSPKSTPSKKPAVKRAAAQKPAVKKTAVKKTAVKKPAVKRAAVKKTAVKETPVAEAASEGVAPRPGTPSLLAGSKADTANPAWSRDVDDWDDEPMVAPTTKTPASKAVVGDDASGGLDADLDDDWGDNAPTTRRQRRGRAVGAAPTTDTDGIIEDDWDDGATTPPPTGAAVPDDDWGDETLPDNITPVPRDDNGGGDAWEGDDWEEASRATVPATVPSDAALDESEGWDESSATTPKAEVTRSVRGERSRLVKMLAIGASALVITASAALYIRMSFAPDETNVPCRTAMGTIRLTVSQYPDVALLPPDTSTRLTGATRTMRASCVFDEVVSFETDVILPWAGEAPGTPEAGAPSPATTPTTSTPTTSTPTTSTPTTGPGEGVGGSAGSDGEAGATSAPTTSAPAPTPIGGGPAPLA